jgi:rhodanese-related sulfurtransferase
MRIRNTAVQIVLMVFAAAAIAVIANGFASRERRLVLPGYYPDAQRIPPRAEGVVPPLASRVVTPPTTTSAPATSTTPIAPPITLTSPEPRTTSPEPLTPSPEPRTPTPVKPPPAQTDISRFTPHPDKAYVEIDYNDVAALHAKGALFLDARRTSVYEEGHIAGSRSFSVWESDIDDKVNALFNERSDPSQQNQPIVIYCSGGACEDSHMLAQKLWGIQFNNVYVYKDGFPDWQKHGGAVKTGANP